MDETIEKTIKNNVEVEKKWPEPDLVYDKDGFIEGINLTEEELSLSSSEFKGWIEMVVNNNISVVEDFNFHRTAYNGLKERLKGKKKILYRFTSLINHNVDWEKVASPNPLQFVPEKYRERNDLIIITPDMFLMSNKDLASKLGISVNKISVFKKAFLRNGYAWWLKDTKTSSYAFEANTHVNNMRKKDFFNELVADNKKEIEGVLEKGALIDKKAYIVKGVDTDDLIEIKLEDFLDKKVEFFEERGISTNYRKTILHKMIDNNQKNIFILKDELRKAHHDIGNIKVDYYKPLKNESGNSIFPEDYPIEQINTDTSRAIKLIARSFETLSKKNNNDGLLKLATVVELQFSENRDDFVAEAKIFLLSIAGDQRFFNDDWRIGSLAKFIRGNFYVIADSRGVSLDQYNSDGEIFSIIDNVSSKKYGDNDLDGRIVERGDIEESKYSVNYRRASKLNGISDKHGFDDGFGSSLALELKSKIKLDNYHSTDLFEEDLVFVDEFMKRKYSIHDGRYEDRDLKEKRESTERFMNIMDKNNIDLKLFT